MNQTSNRAFIPPAIFFLLVLMQNVAGSFAQSPEQQKHWVHWVHNSKTAGSSYSQDVVADQAGFVYQVGWVTDSIWLPQENRYFNADTVADAFIEKLDPDGRPLWVQVLSKGDSVPTNPEQLHIAVLPNGNIVVGGSSESSMDLDPGPGIALHRALRSGTIFISCYSPDGEYLWHKNAYSDQGMTMTSMEVGKNGEIICSGPYNKSAFFYFNSGDYKKIEAFTSDQNYVCTVTQDGEFKTVVSFSGNVLMSISDVAMNNQGDMFIIGVFIGKMDLNPGPQEYQIESSSSFTAVFLVKLNNSGKFLWGGQIDGPYEQIGTSVTIDENGNSYWAGYILGTTDLDPTPAEEFFVGSTSRDGFLIRMSPDNQYLMGRTYPRTSPSSMIGVEAGKNGNVYLLGSTINQIRYSTMNTAPSKIFFISPNGKMAYYTVSVDSIGDPSEVHIMLSDFNYHLQDISVDQNDNIYVSGNTADIIEVDSLRFGNSYYINRPNSTESAVIKFNSSQAIGNTTIATCHSYTDYRGIKYDYDSKAIVETVPRPGMSDSFVRINLIVKPFSRYHQPLAYPNPNTGTFYLSNYTYDADLRIFNSMGQQLLQETAFRGPYLVDLNLASGVYYVVMHSECGTYSEKVVVR